jgi:hypothetical protein
MAVVVITSQTRNPKAAKATIRYIVHRREKNQRVTRELFDAYATTGKRNAYRAIDKALPGTTFLRIAISPDPNGEDRDKNLNLRELTRKTLRVLQRKFPNQSVKYFGSLHSHTENRHVNLLVLLKGKVTKTHLRLMREASGGNAKQQRSLAAPTMPKQQLRDKGKARARNKLLKEQKPRQMGIARVAKTPALPCPVCKYKMQVVGVSYECKHCTLNLFAGRSFLKERADSQMLYLRRAREVMGEW